EVVLRCRPVSPEVTVITRAGASIDVVFVGFGGVPPVVGAEAIGYDHAIGAARGRYEANGRRAASGQYRAEQDYPQHSTHSPSPTDSCGLQITRRVLPRLV